MTEVLIKIQPMHAGQLSVVKDAARFNVLECGRRFGKSTLGIRLAVKAAINHALPVGWFAPTYKILEPSWAEVCRILAPVTLKKNEAQKQISLINGGLIDFWTLDTPDPARGRKYKRVVLDEVGMARNLQVCWEQAIRPTLTDYIGDAFFLFTPKGGNYAHKLFLRGQGGDVNWKSWRLPSTTNPHISAAEIEAARLELPKHVFEQEYLGIPADDGGNPFGLAAINACLQSDFAPGPVVCWGVDLAKSQDWTVIIGLNDQGRICMADRWQAPWRTTMMRLKDMLGNAPALIDATGVGDPIVEELQTTVGYVEGFRFTSQSKQMIMVGLASGIQTGSVGVLAGWLASEMETFQYEYTATGVRYTAPVGMHDDGVCALALAYHKLGSIGRQTPVEAAWIGGDYDEDED
jgi:hypothetical protein